jgi:hypothetical protein
MACSDLMARRESEWVFDSRCERGSSWCVKSAPHRVINQPENRHIAISCQVNQLCSVLCGKCLRFGQREKWQLLAVETNDANRIAQAVTPARECGNALHGVCFNLRYLSSSILSSGRPTKMDGTRATISHRSPNHRPSKNADSAATTPIASVTTQIGSSPISRRDALLHAGQVCLPNLAVR